MSTQPAPEENSGTVAATPKVVEADSLADRIKGIYESVADRAYELFYGRDGAVGSDLDDWLRAESELLRPMSVEILESESEIVVHAEVPGFKATDIEVSVEPTRLTITGTREESSERTAGERAYSERSSSQIYRSLTLPSEVEPGKAAATLSDGVLTLKMAKPPKPEAKDPDVVPV